MSALSKPNDPRNGIIAKVHVAKKQLRLDDASYRAILLRVTGKASSADCSIAALEELLREFTRLGWSARKTAPARAGKRPLADSEIALKLRALWISAYELGVVDDPREEALSAFVKRVSGGKQRGVDAIQWLSAADARKAVEGLKSWMEREASVDWSVGNPRRAVGEAQWRIVSRTMDPGQAGDMAAYASDITGYPALDGYSNRDWDILIRHLGEKVRAAKVEK